jgi:hypothetical protein
VVRAERLRITRQRDRARVDGLTLRVSALLAVEQGSRRAPAAAVAQENRPLGDRS